MFVDVGKTDTGAYTNWVAESGVLDLFLLLGPTPVKVGGRTLPWSPLSDSTRFN
jgi:hypothetical protein